jgi:predicted aconitase with swiveling domain
MEERKQMEPITIQGRGAIAGRTEGVALVCPKSITGWSGINPLTGKIKDYESEDRGKSIKGKILVIPGSRGSNGWSCFLSITRVSGVSPKGLLITKIDSSSAVAAVGLGVPTITDFPEENDPCALIKTGDYLVIDGTTGTVTIKGR